MKKIAIFGSGGHAREIIDICYALGYVDIALLLLPHESPGHDKSLKYNSETDIPKLKEEGYSFAIGIGDGKLRFKIANKYNDLHYPSLVHPDVSFGRAQRCIIETTTGTVVAAGARFMSSIKIGKFCTFGLNCTIGHDSIIGDFVSIMPGANISGYVNLMSCCYIGSGAIVLQGNSENMLTLHEGLVVGAGAVVTKSFNKGSVIAGVPAVIKS